jgi:hypothetical protein
MPNPLIKKLERLAALTQAEKQALEGAVARTRDLPPGVDLIQAGERPTDCTLLWRGGPAATSCCPKASARSQGSSFQATCVIWTGL